MTGEELESWRMSNNLTRENLAEFLRVDYTTVYRWEASLRKIPPFLNLAIESIERKLSSNANNNSGQHQKILLLSEQEWIEKMKNEKTRTNF